MCTGVGNFVRVPSRTYDLSARHGSAGGTGGSLGLGALVFLVSHFGKGLGPWWFGALGCLGVPGSGDGILAISLDLAGTTSGTTA